MVLPHPPAVVRRARVDDADAIGRVHVTSWQAAYAGALPEDILAGLSIEDRQRRWRERLADLPPSVHVLVVTDDGTLAGFACVSASRDEDATASTGELQSIYLDPEHWGRGLGWALHEEALARLRQDGYRRATLWVLDGNGRARRFYARAGWSVDGATKADSLAGSPPVTEIRYKRDL